MSGHFNNSSGALPATAESVSPNLMLDQHQGLVPRRSVPHALGDVLYATPNAQSQWRVDTLFSKEPETIEWIAGFRRGEILVDIGANVGMYTIWAAKTRGVRVFAFEPESQNYALLYKNIVLNNLSKQVVAYCAALSNHSGYSMLHLNRFETGSASHSLGEQVDYQLKYRESEVSQGCISATLDSLVMSGVVPMPDYIKIDIDGFEHQVVAGSTKVLADQHLKSVLIEININLVQHRRLIADMRAFGFEYSEEQVARAIRTEGPFTGIGNYIFSR